MKIYKLPSSEGHYELIGYRCDNCDLTIYGESSPLGFLIEHDCHYCWECITYCHACCKTFSVKYAKDWFQKGLCENCQEILLKGEKK